MKKLNLLAKQISISTALIVGLAALPIDTFGMKKGSSSNTQEKEEQNSITPVPVSQENAEDNKTTSIYQTLWGKDSEETEWSSENIEFCKHHYGKNPQELTEIPEEVIRVEPHLLGSLTPNASMVWRLGIKRAHDSYLKNT